MTILLIIITLTTAPTTQASSSSSSKSSPSSSSSKSSSSSPSSSSSSSSPHPGETLTTNCIVDHCAVCPNSHTLRCKSCKSGWYLRTFDSGDKVYNACWSTMKLTLGILASILSSMLLCGICYLCYTLGQKTYVRRPLEELGKEQAKEIMEAQNNLGNFPTIQKSPVVIQENPVVFQGPTGSTYVTQGRFNSPRIMSTGREVISPRSPRVTVRSPPRIISEDPRVRVLR